MELSNFKSTACQPIHDLIEQVSGGDSNLPSLDHRSQFKHALEAPILLEQFVYGYVDIVDEEIDSDDEVLNWVFAEAMTDFAAAGLLTLSGFYKASSTCVRSALELATVALCYQIRENQALAKGQSGYGELFLEWTDGERDTPNWGEMRTVLANSQAFASFSEGTGCAAEELAYDLFKGLSAYTHSRGYGALGEPITSLNMGYNPPDFDERYWSRSLSHLQAASSAIAGLWLVAFPKLADCHSLGPLDSPKYEHLLGSHLLGIQAHAHFIAV